MYTNFITGCGLREDLGRMSTTKHKLSNLINATEEAKVDLPIQNPFDNVGSIPLPAVYQKLHEAIHKWAISVLRPNEQMYWRAQSYDFVSPGAKYVIVDHPLDQDIGGLVGNINLEEKSKIRSKMWLIDDDVLKDIDHPPLPAWQVLDTASSDRFLISRRFGPIGQNELYVPIRAFRIRNTIEELVINKEFFECNFLTISDSGNCIGMTKNGGIYFGKVVGNSVIYKFAKTPKSLQLDEYWETITNPTTPVWNKNGDIVLLCEQVVVSAETGQLIANIRDDFLIQYNGRLANYFIGLSKSSKAHLPPSGTLIVGRISDDGSIDIVKNLGTWSKLPFLYNISPNAQYASGRAETLISKIIPIPGAGRVSGYVRLNDLQNGTYTVRPIERRVAGWVTITQPK